MGSSLDAGIKAAFKTNMTELLTAPELSSIEGAAPAFSGLSSRPGASHAPASPSPEHVRMDSLIERVRQAVESQRPPEPRHLVFQLDPPKLGLIQVDMQWTAKGWNINWSVTQNEVRDWLIQQLPSLQQQNNDTQITWQAPTVQTSLWDFSKQANSRFLDHQMKEALLVDEEPVSEEEIPLRANEFWA